MLIFETYLQANDPNAADRFSPDHLLQDGELRRAFPALQTIAYRESHSRSSEAPARQASLIAVRPPAL
jgi:hypothetical protein